MPHLPPPCGRQFKLLQFAESAFVHNTFTPYPVRCVHVPSSARKSKVPHDCESTNNDPEIPYPACIPRRSSTSTDDNTLVEEILGPYLFDTVVANLTFFDETMRVGKTRITASTALIYHFNVTYGDWLCTSILAKSSLHQSVAAAPVMKRSLCSWRYTRIRSRGGPPPDFKWSVGITGIERLQLN